MNNRAYLMAFLCLPTILAGQDYLSEFQEKWTNGTAYTLEVAELMPDTAYQFKPTEDQMTFQEQLLHICGNMTWLSTTYLNGKDPGIDLKKEGYSKSEMIGILKTCLENAGEAVKNLPEATLNDQVDFFAGPKSKRQILTLMNDHMTHHRGQLLVYLRLREIAPPRYRGW